MLISVIAHDLKLFRKREKLYVFSIRNKILHDILIRFRFLKYVNYILENLTLKILNFCFNFMDYHFIV